MFGLMRPLKSCGTKNCCTPEDYKQHRLHYCGTCKTIGQEYGHKARFALNYDAVFMSELLTVLNEDDTKEWGGALQAVNRCLTMPDKNEEMPISLQYAAASNVFLAELKLDDNIKDKAKKRYKMARWFLSKSFKQASQKLENWGLDTNFFWAEVSQQVVLEKSGNYQFEDLRACLSHYAQPTQNMTSALFAQAADVLGKPELKPVLHQLGANFGQMMYVLDAFEDVEKDIFQSQFNPLVGWFNANETLQKAEFEQVRNEILSIQQETAQTLNELNLPETILESFQSRLLSNISLRLYREREIPLTFSQKIARRWQNARTAADNWLCHPNSWARKLQYQFVSIAFFILPQLSVELTYQERSQVLGWAAIFTALLASVGLYKSVVPLEKKKAGLWQRFKNMFKKRKSSDPCLVACCECCCQTCADQSCQICCEVCCDDDGCCNCSNWTKNDWRTFLWVTLILIALIGIAVVLVIFFL